MVIHQKAINNFTLLRPKSYQKTINDLSLYMSVRCGVVVVGQIEGELSDPSCVDVVVMMKNTTKFFL